MLCFLVEDHKDSMEERSNLEVVAHVEGQQQRNGGRAALWKRFPIFLSSTRVLQIDSYVHEAFLVVTSGAQHWIM